MFISDSMDEFRQFFIWNIVVSSWSKFLLKGTGLCYQLEFFFDQSYGTYDGSLIRTLLCGCFLAEPTSISKKNEKNNEIEMVPDQTQLRSKTFLIRPKCARKGYDQTQLRSKSALIRPKCARIRLWSDLSDQINLWSDHLQTIVKTVVRSNFLPDPVISVWENTGVRSTGSDHKPIWVWTSTWDVKSPWVRAHCKNMTNNFNYNLL